MKIQRSRTGMTVITRSGGKQIEHIEYTAEGLKDIGGHCQTKEQRPENQSAGTAGRTKNMSKNSPRNQVIRIELCQHQPTS